MISSRSGRTNVKILAAAAVVMLAAAIGLYQMEETSSSAKFERKKLFKSLNLSDIAEVKITTESDTVDLKKKSENLWGLESRGGYPIENDRLQRLVLAIAELEAADLMTSNKDKYEKMGLKEEKPENGKIQFLDKDAKPLGELYVGAVRNSGGSDEGFKPPDGQYVRVGGDDNVYKIKDQLQVDKLPASWLMRDVLKVEAAHLQSLKLESGKTTDSYTVSRSAADPFKLTSAIPENYKEKATMVSSVGNCLSNVTLTDVLPSADPKVKDIDFSTTFTATQKNGLVYVLSLGKLLEDRYIKIAASYDKAADFSLADERTSDSVTAKLL
ncbi:DUF4340 domain-containing protein [Candidatus Sumerlaeota bacterium]|nr:DUF4340 domain-containing protein [Candidatus Sumerlaeota bacterium]